MEKELKEIFLQQGKNILTDPDQLMQLLRERNCDETQIMTLGLVLKGCPTVGNLLQQEQLTEAESNMLCSAAVNQTGLSVVAARRILHTVMTAAGMKSAWRPQLLIYERVAEKTLTTMTPDEVKHLDQLEAQLNQGNVSSEVIHDLDVLSEKGSIRASYLLGEYFRKKDLRDSTADGMQYYRRAAKLGYGPAFGALADYMIRSNRKNMATAAACFEDPTSITGHHGRTWKTLAERLLTYREENKKRTGSMLLLQGLLLAMTILLLSFGFVSTGFFGILAVVVQVLSLGYLVYASFFGPYFTCKVTGYAMLLSWLALAFAML